MVRSSYLDEEYRVPVPAKLRELINIVSLGTGGRRRVPYVVRGSGRVSIIYNVTRETRENLKSLAMQAGFGSNVTMLLEALGQGILQITPNPAFDEEVEVEEDTNDEIE